MRSPEVSCELTEKQLNEDVLLLHHPQSLRMMKVRFCSVDPAELCGTFRV